MEQLPPISLRTFGEMTWGETTEIHVSCRRVICKCSTQYNRNVISKYLCCRLRYFCSMGKILDFTFQKLNFFYRHQVNSLITEDCL